MELTLILCLHHTGTLSKNLSLQLRNCEYQSQCREPGYSLRNSRGALCGDLDGTVAILYQGRTLNCRTSAEGEPQFHWMTRKVCTPPSNRPKQTNSKEPLASPLSLTHGKICAR